MSKQARELVLPKGLDPNVASLLRLQRAMIAELLYGVVKIANTPASGPRGPGAGSGWVHWVDQANALLDCVQELVEKKQ